MCTCISGRSHLLLSCDTIHTCNRWRQLHVHHMLKIHAAGEGVLRHEQSLLILLVHCTWHRKKWLGFSCIYFVNKTTVKKCMCGR